MPRIISGTARGTHLIAPKGEATRPTADRTKEALFSIISPLLPAASFLDIFSGTGQIGLEAASRGAQPVVMIEKSAAALTAIRANLARTHLENQAAIMNGEAAACLRQLASQQRRFSLIFLDPPYESAFEALTGLAFLLVQLLVPDGMVILEHESSKKPPAFVTYLQLRRSCQYGTAMLSFYKVDQNAGKPVNP